MLTSQGVYSSEGRMAVRRVEDSNGPGYSSMRVAIIIFCCLFFLRLPTILAAHELNVDESQMLSQGMKYLLDPVPWRAVDGTTSGPLNSYFISIFLLMGFRASYALAHILATGLVASQVVIAYQTLKRLTSKRAAAWGILPMMFALGFSRNRNYLHYSSELLAALMLALAFYLFVLWMQMVDERAKHRRLMFALASGLTVGCAPWCKLQALPMAALLSGLIFLAMLFGDSTFRNSPGWRIASTASLCIGSILPSCVILGVVARGGAIKDFWYSYILSNLRYAEGLDFFLVFRHLGLAIARPEILPLFFACFLAAIILFLQVMDKRDVVVSSQGYWVLGMLSCWIAAALFAVSRPHYFFSHYTIFLFYPMTCFASLLFYWEFSLFKKESLNFLTRWTRLCVEAVTLFLLLFTAYQIVANERNPADPDGNERIADAVREIRWEHSVKSIAIWGWAPGVYVLTGIPPATRDAIPYNAINRAHENAAHGNLAAGPDKLQAYFAHRFVSDLRNSPPDLFIDAVAPGVFMWRWTVDDGYESDVETRELVDRNYREIKELSLATDRKPVRFFIRREDSTR